MKNYIKYGLGFIIGGTVIGSTISMINLSKVVEATISRISQSKGSEISFYETELDLIKYKKIIPAIIYAQNTFAKEKLKALHIYDEIYIRDFPKNCFRPKETEACLINIENIVKKD